MSVGFEVDVDVVLGCFEMSKPANCCVTDRIDDEAIMRVYAEGGAHWREGKGTAEWLERTKARLQRGVVHFRT